MSTLLDPSAVISQLPAYLPSGAKVLTSPQDALAALSHTILTAVGFRLDPHQGSILPDDWNKNAPEDYTFKYRHEQSSLQFVIKVSKMGTRTLVNAIALESDKVASFDVATNDFVSPSFFPHDLATQTAQPLIHGFISSNRVSDYVAQYKLKIIQKLVPGLQKEGYLEEGETSATGPSTSQNPPPARPYPQSPPNAPDRDQNQPTTVFPRNPLEIGRRDRDPFPENPFASPSLFPPDGDGMFVGPNHPIFNPRRGQGTYPDRGPWGGDGFLPPMGAPPGARFDPVGPSFGGSGLGPFGPGRGRGGPPGGGNMRGPDNDEFLPPGMGDMYM